MTGGTIETAKGLESRKGLDGGEEAVKEKKMDGWMKI